MIRPAMDVLAEAATHAVHTLNLTPGQRKRHGGMSPYRIRTDKEHDVSILHPFGCWQQCTSNRRNAGANYAQPQT